MFHRQSRTTQPQVHHLLLVCLQCLALARCQSTSFGSSPRGENRDSSQTPLQASTTPLSHAQNVQNTVSSTVSTDANLQPSSTQLSGFSLLSAMTGEITPALPSQSYASTSPFLRANSTPLRSTALQDLQRATVLSRADVFSNVGSSIDIYPSETLTETVSPTVAPRSLLNVSSSVPDSLATSSSTLSPSNVDLSTNSTSYAASSTTVASSSHSMGGNSGPSHTSTNKPVYSTTKLPQNSSSTTKRDDRHPRGGDDRTLTTPAIIGIGFGAAATTLVIVGVVLLLLKRKVYHRNKQDSTNFWDDNVTLSYINSHADFPKDLDAEMMSLDDDSFLNSLDSMTFANLWAADTAKHTNF